MTSSIITPPDSEIAKKTAKILLDIEAINIRPEEPYKLTAGWASPVYIDCRKVISFPKERMMITEMTAQILQQQADGASFDIIAGGETAGIPYAAWLSEYLKLPMVYIRKKPKGFGRQAQIEGDLAEGANVLLVEDLATDGGSKVNFVNAIRDAGGKCSHTSVVFFYGVFPGGGAALNDLDVQLHYLTDWNTVLEVVESEGYFQDKDLASVKNFLEDPVSWSGAHGGLAETPPAKTAAQ